VKEQLAILFVVILSLGACSQYPNANTTPVTTQTAIASVTTTQAAVATLSSSVSTVTQGEQWAMEEVKHNNLQSADSPDQCPVILQTQPWCSVVQSAKRISLPEWDELFQQTEFYLVEYELIGREDQYLRHVLVIKQNGQRYSADNFDHLLNASRIVITDTNRELTAKAFALMTISDYLDNEIVFTQWEHVNYTAQQKRHAYNYCLRGWTKLNGLDIQWCFVYGDNGLSIATGPAVQQAHTGNYLPSEQLQSPIFEDYLFGRD
jgi:hypothetical protein